MHQNYFGASGTAHSPNLASGDLLNVRSVDFDDLPFNPAVGIRRIRVTQAINHDMIDEIARTDTGTPDDALAAQITNFTANARVEIVSHGEQVTLTYGDLLIATLEMT
jgi:hypothetical protein